MVNLIKKEKGFTLIELIIVIAIIVILVAIITPKISDMREDAIKSQTKTDLKNIRTKLETERNLENEGSYPNTLGSVNIDNNNYNYSTSAGNKDYLVYRKINDKYYYINNKLSRFKISSDEPKTPGIPSESDTVLEDFQAVLTAEEKYYNNNSQYTNFYNDLDLAEADNPYDNSKLGQYNQEMLNDSGSGPQDYKIWGATVKEGKLDYAFYYNSQYNSEVKNVFAIMKNAKLRLEEYYNNNGDYAGYTFTEPIFNDSSLFFTNVGTQSARIHSDIYTGGTLAILMDNATSYDSEHYLSDGFNEYEKLGVTFYLKP